MPERLAQQVKLRITAVTRVQWQASSYGNFRGQLALGEDSVGPHLILFVIITPYCSVFIH